MEIKGKISILFDPTNHGLKIELHDPDSVTSFATIRLNAKQTCEALARVARTDCKVEISNLDRVGKIREDMQLEFEIPELKYRDREAACKFADKYCPKGWVASNYFGSQDSFFKRDGKFYARTWAFRWIDKE